jgi:mannose-6-phosphate isomerase-like protein (cupin superfamily)
MSDQTKNNRRVTIDEALSLLPNSDGKRFATVFEHGTLSVEIYSPRGEDLQQPHTRDEVYIVMQGSGEFINGDLRHPFQTGDFLFAPAGIVHRFVNFTDDLVVWVIFYGPEGGESDGK